MNIFHKPHTYLVLVTILLFLVMIPLTLGINNREQKNQNKADASGSKFVIYLGSLASGWKDWSSVNAGVSLNSKTVKYQGYNSISFIARESKAQLYLHTRSSIDTSSYSHLSFVIQASTLNQQYLAALVDTNDSIIKLLPLSNYNCNPVVGSWTTCSIPLTDLEANGHLIRGFILKEGINKSEPVVYVNSISLVDENIAVITSTPTATEAPTITQIVTSPTNPMPTLSPTPTTPASTGTLWLPKASSPLHYQLQLGVAFNPSTDMINGVQVYDIDGFDNSSSVVSTIHAAGAKAICYIDVGTWENWRSDASSFPSSILGNSNGWPGEKWLDIRQINILQPIMANRFAMCKSKGFDAVDPDNIDGYSNSSGFPLTAQDQLNYNIMISNLAHQYGMSVGQKNDVDQISQLQPYFDWAMNEECYKYNECNTLQPYVNANKAVFQVEYNNKTTQCSSLNSMHVNSYTRDLNLVSPTTSGYVRLTCTPDTQNSW